jgi:hypothetical protein
MAFGVQDLFSLSAPTVGYVNESTETKTIEAATLRDQDGVTQCVAAKPLITIEVTHKGMGGDALGTLAAGTLSSTGTLQITSQKRTETNSEYPEFDVSAKGYDDLGSIADPTGPSAPTPDASSDPACPLLGLTSVGYSGCESFELEEVIDEAPVGLDADGSFDHQYFFDPTFNWTVKGIGSMPATLTLGSDGGLPDTVSEFSTGVTMLLSLKEEQKLENPSWEASGQHWPSAA